MEEVDHTKLKAVMFFVAFLTLGLLLFAINLSYKIFNLIKFTDKPFLFSIFAITLALTCFLCYCCLYLAKLYLPDDSFLNTENGTDIMIVIDNLKVMLILCAFVFDLYKWGIFLIATSNDVS